MGPQHRKSRQPTSSQNSISQATPDSHSYIKELHQLSKKEAKTLIIARYGMLECGKNFKGTRCVERSTCLCLDDEEHRLNYCPVFSSTNYPNCPTKIKFESIFSENIEDIREALAKIESVWNTHTGQGSMNVT